MGWNIFVSLHLKAQISRERGEHAQIARVKTFGSMDLISSIRRDTREGMEKWLL